MGNLQSMIKYDVNADIRTALSNANALSNAYASSAISNANAQVSVVNWIPVSEVLAANPTIISLASQSAAPGHGSYTVRLKCVHGKFREAIMGNGRQIS